MLLSKFSSKIKNDETINLLLFISSGILLVSFYLLFSWYILIAIFLLSEFLFLFEKKINNPSLGRVALKKIENIYEATFYLSIINLIIFVIIKINLEQAIKYFVYFVAGIFGTIALIIVIWIWLKLNKKIIKKQLKGGK